MSTTESTEVHTALYEVRAPGHDPHRMVLCECCWEDTAAYYDMLNWPFYRVRDLTSAEGLSHSCLD